MFDAGAVVPAAVENHYLAAGREMRDVALQEDLGLLPVRWRWQGDHAEHSWAYFLGKSFDGAALAGGIAASNKMITRSFSALTHSCRWQSCTCSSRSSFSYAFRFILGAASSLAMR